MGNFLKFSRKIQRCPFWLKIGTNGILEVLIPNPDLDFWNSNPKIHFLANFCRKSQSCPFCLKMYTHGISRIPILIPTSIFWISNHKSIFWGKYGPKKLKLSVLPENWYTWYLEDADSYSDISILNFKTYIHFWANLGQKSQSWLTFGMQNISSMLILIPTLDLWFYHSKFIFGHIWGKQIEVVCFSWKLAYRESWGCYFILRN